MPDAIFDTVLQVVLFLMTLMLIPTAYRLIKGPRIADRMLSIDLITTLLTALIVLLAVIEEQSIFIDVALALSALSFIATLAIARFVGEGSVF